MVRKGLEKLIWSVRNDEQERARFKVDPQSVVNEYRLTGAEQKAVLNPRVRLALSNGNTTMADDYGILETWL